MDVSYRGRTVGWVEIDAGQRGVHWQAVCRVQTGDILRLYGLRDGCAPLRIDVAEPVGEELHVQRTLTWHTLRAAGYDADHLPTHYVLDAGDGRELHVQPPAMTGDARLDALIADGTLTCCPDGDGWCVSLPFSAGQACPLAFALTACTLTADGRAVLRVRRRHNR